MKNKVSKIGLENRVLTPKLFSSVFSSMQERVKIYLSLKYRYSVNGNRATAQNVDDYLQNGFERMLQGFDFTNCLWNNEPITIYQFQKVWFYLSQQCVYADNVRSTMSKKGQSTKIVVSNIVVQEDGKENVLNIVEEKLIDLDRKNVKNLPNMNVRAIIRKAIEKADNDRDRMFYQRLLAHLIIENSVRKASKIGKAIPLSDIIDCFENQFKSADAYFMWRKRMESDSRLQKLRMVA